MTRTPLLVTTETRLPSCEHAWATRSTHRTSEGLLSYVACVRCAVLRVDLRRTAAAVPEAASRATRPRGVGVPGREPAPAAP